jgi:SAM-dependent methyltransferase
MRTRFARWALETACRIDPSLQQERAAAAMPTPLPNRPSGGFHGVGLRDLKRTGWFNDTSTELCRGFPIGPDDIVVDVGCGNGAKAQFCARFAREIIAIDIDTARVEDTLKRMQSTAKARFTVRPGTAYAIPVESGMATKVICSEVLEHVEDPRHVLEELFRIGKPGATYLLSVPDPRSEAVSKHLAPPSAFQSPYHIHIFARDIFAGMVADAGFIVQQHSSHGFFVAVSQALLWTLEPESVGMFGPRGKHPVLDRWALTWNTLLELPRGEACKLALDAAMPKTQVIIATKP